MDESRIKEREEFTLSPVRFHHDEVGFSARDISLLAVQTIGSLMWLPKILVLKTNVLGNPCYGD